MAAWERFLTGDPDAEVPARNFVVASWLRSQLLGVNPTGRSAPMAVQGLGADIEVADWADRLPEGLRAEWFNPVKIFCSLMFENLMNSKRLPLVERF